MNFKSIKGIKNASFLNLDDETKRKLKTAGAVTGGIVAALYAAFLILPNFIDLNKFTPQISSEIEKLSGFKLEADTLKLSTTPRLGVKVKAEKIALNYKNESPLFSLKKPEVEINLPTILIGHINLDKIKADDADIYLTFTKDKKYTVMEYIENVLKNTAPQNEEQSTNEGGFTFPIELRNINITADKIGLHIFDENVDKTYLAELNNSSLRLKSLEGPLSLKTTGFIGIEDTDVEFVNIDADFKTKLPKISDTNKPGENKDEEFVLPDINFNPLKTLEDFNFKTDITAKVDIKDIEDFKANGAVNINNFSLKLDEIQLPKSYLNLNFKDRNIDVDSKVFVSNEEFIETKSAFKTGKKSKMDLNVKTDKVTIKSLKDIIGAVLNICCVENDIKNMTARGYIKGDFNLDTDFKTIKSNGSLKLVDGDIRYSKAGLVLSNIGAFLDFSDNMLKIKDTSALVNGAKFDVKGEIAQNADINLTVKSDPLKIKDLINIATEFKAINKKDIADFEFNDGALTVGLNVIGDFKNIQPKADIDLNSFKMLVKSAKMPISIEDINIVARPEGKDNMDAVINVKNVKAAMKEPQLNFSAPGAKITADMENITIEPLNATLEGTKIALSGNVTKYMTNPELNIKVNGNVHPNTVLAFIPKEFRNGIKYGGAMPYNALIAGTLDNIKITGDLTSNAANYISIVEIPAYKGQTNTLDIDMALKNDVLEINSAAVKSQGAKLAQAKGRVEKIYAKEPYLSGLNIGVLNKTNIVIPMLSNASFDAIGDITLSGKAFSPEITGNVNVSAFKYPEFGFTFDDLALNFNKTAMGAKLKGGSVAKSDFAGDANISTNFAHGVTINNLNYTSNYIDTDALIALADKVMKSIPAPAPSAGAASSQPADLGVVINGGSAKIGKLKSGTLFIDNINYNHTLLNNVYKLNDLVATFAQGTAKGTCSYNVMNGKIGVDMQADNISMKEAAKQFIGAEIVQSGTLAGSAKLSLSGATLQEQMRTLNGTVSFDVKDGQYGENISFGRFINAANVFGAGSFASNLNTITSKVNSVNTQEFKDINGILTFNNGVASVSTFKSSGPNMSLYANGTYNLLNNYANLKITGKISSKVAGLLGTLGVDKIETTVQKATTAAENAINKVADNLNAKYGENKGVQAGIAILGAIKNAKDGTTGATTTQDTEQKTAGQIVTSIVKEKLNPIFGTISANDIANIPALSTNETENTKNFQVVINGSITSPKSVKSLKFQKTASTAGQ